MHIGMSVEVGGGGECRGGVVSKGRVSYLRLYHNIIWGRMQEGCGGGGGSVPFVSLNIIR